MGTGGTACRTAPNPPEAATEIFGGSPPSRGLLLILLVITAVPMKTLPPEPGIDRVILVPGSLTDSFVIHSHVRDISVPLVLPGSATYNTYRSDVPPIRPGTTFSVT